MGIDQLAILRRPECWKGPGGLAAVPLLLTGVVPIIFSAGPKLSIPFLSDGGFTYNVDGLFLMVIFVSGAAIGATRRFPLWAYSWTVLAITSTLVFLATVSSGVFMQVTEASFTQAALILSLGSILGALLVLAFAVSRTRLGFRFVFFAVAVSLAGASVKLSLVGFLPSVSVPGLILSNSLIIIITLLELAVVLAMVMQFVTGNEQAQRRAVYVLLAVVALDPVLTGWGWFFNLPEMSLSSMILPIVIMTSGKWLTVVVSLLITWGCSVLFIKYRPRSNKPDLRGTSNAG